MRASCSVANARPVHKQLVHITLPVPLHVEQNVRAPPCATSLPREPHWAHGRYPVPLQYTQRALAFILTLFTSTNKSIVMTPTAPPVKDATMGSTWAAQHSRPGQASWSGDRDARIKRD